MPPKRPWLGREEAERNERTHNQYQHHWGGLEEEAFPAHMHAPAKRIDLVLGGRNQIAGRSSGLKGFGESNLNAENKTQRMLLQQRQEVEERRQEASAAEHNVLFKAVLAWKAYVEMVEHRLVSRTPPEDDDGEDAEECRNAPHEGQQDENTTFEQSLSKELERWSTREPSAPRPYQDVPSIANIASPRSLQQAITISSTPETTTSTSERKQAQAREKAEAPTGAQFDTRLQTPRGDASAQLVVPADVKPSLAEDWGWLGRSRDIARVVREHTRDQQVGRTLESSIELARGDVTGLQDRTVESGAAAVSHRWKAEMGASFKTTDEAGTEEIKQLSSTEKEKEQFGSELRFNEAVEAPDEDEGRNTESRAGGSTC